MKNIKRVLSGVMALSLTMGLTACGGGESTVEDAAEVTTVTTTTAVTVEINEEGLKDGEQGVLESALAELPEAELENKVIKWMAHYDINPSTTGESKKIDLEMFEQKYGGSIEYYPTTWNTRYSDLSTNILGGEGIDFFPADTYNLPKGVVSGMFQSVDQYIDMDSDIWSKNKSAMEIFCFSGKHYQLVTNVTAEQVCLYNKKTIEENGFDDPWELYEAGNWNWDTFKNMLMEFVDVEAGLYGLDNWYNEKALFLSAGVPLVGTDDSGNLKVNIKDPTVEMAMNYQYDLYNNGLVLPLQEFDWQIQPQMMGEGKQLFWLNGTWGVQGDPTTWTIKVEPENLGIAPVPSPEGSDPYQSASLEGFVICKGAANPEGVVKYAECVIVANNNEGAIAISDRKAMDDNEWSEEFIERKKVTDELARQYPVYDLAAGCSSDIASITVDTAEIGMRAAFHGIDWATTRDSINDTVEVLVDEVNTALKDIAAQ